MFSLIGDSRPLDVNEPAIEGIAKYGFDAVQRKRATSYVAQATPMHFGFQAAQGMVASGVQVKGTLDQRAFYRVKRFGFASANSFMSRTKPSLRC